jgi:hypothetical protein
MSDNKVLNDLVNSDTDVVINNYISSVNDDKILLLTLTTALAVYSGFFADSVAAYDAHTLNIFSNPFFQVAVFVIILHIIPLSPALGFALGIAILVTLQAVRDIKVKTLMEGFNLSNQVAPMDKSNMNNQHEVYLSNPVAKASANVPTTNLKLVPIDVKYDNMIQSGKNLLENSQNMKNELKKRPDDREEKIADMIENKGKRMINSGINRLESSDDGVINKINSKSKFIKYDKSLATNNHGILSKYDELQTNFDKLPTIKNNTEFEQQLNKTQKNELELLELIYKNKKDSFSKKKQEQINERIDNIKLLYAKNKPWNTELNQLPDLLL